MSEAINPTSGETIILKVDGMGCQSCVAAVEKAVRSKAPEADIAVDLAGGLVTIRGTALGRDALAATITDAGYDVIAA